MALRCAARGDVDRENHEICRGHPDTEYAQTERIHDRVPPTVVSSSPVKPFSYPADATIHNNLALTRRSVAHRRFRNLRSGGRLTNGPAFKCCKSNVRAPLLRGRALPCLLRRHAGLRSVTSALHFPAIPHPWGAAARRAVQSRSHQRDLHRLLQSRRHHPPLHPSTD